MCTLRSVVRPLLTALLAVGVVLRPGPAASLGTAFTYQGQLQQSGLPANGSCDMQFSLFNAASRGAQIGSTQAAPAVSVTNGLFTVPLDFGSVFTGAELYLEIQVRCPAGGGSYVLLSPRQHLTGAPYALYAPTAGNLSCSGCVTAGDLASGAVTGSAILDGAIAQSKLAFTPVLSVGANAPLTSSLGQTPSISLTGIVPVLNGGTGASTAPTARANLSAAASGDNGDITSLSGITGNITLPDSTGSGGNILKGGVLFLHNFGTNNTFVGKNAGNPTLTGTLNTAVGSGALFHNTTGYYNTAVGSAALSSNTAGYDNTALGRGALNHNQSFDRMQCTAQGIPNPCCQGVGTGNCDGNGNTALGSAALLANTTGSYNTAVGPGALSANTTGAVNTAVGPSALLANTTGVANTAVGSDALYSNTTGIYNTAVGEGALLNNRTSYDVTLCTGSHTPNICCTDAGKGDCEGDRNTAVGSEALYTNTTGHDNTAVGLKALNANTTGPYNTAVGTGSLYSNTTGLDNSALGGGALYSNTSGSENIAVGTGALYSNDSGTENTAVGPAALASNITGFANIAVGKATLVNNTYGQENVAMGYLALNLNTTGSSNVAIGRNAGHNLTTGDANIDIGNFGVEGESNTIRIGTKNTQTATYIAGIYGTTSSSGVAVFVNADGQLGTATSSARFKTDIQDMGDASNGLMKLRPVRFRYKQDLDPSGLEQYGLVAEEVARTYPDLVTYDDSGRPQSVRYHFVNAMLLNEVQKQARQIGTQQEQIAVQARQIEAQAQQLEALTARLGQVETVRR